MVSGAVDGLDDAALSQRPNAQSNSMSWLIWHMSRVADRFINTRLQDTPQLWTDGGWSEKFGMAPDPDEFGIGWTSEQVGGWQAPAQNVLMGYYGAVNGAAVEYIQGLSSSDLEREMPSPNPPGVQTVAEALGILVWDNIVHGGQVAYLRGYYQGMGWFR
jgi:hypothetical protein